MESALVVQLGLETLVYPALVTAVCFWLVARLFNLESAAATSLAAGYLTVHWLAIGLPPTPPVETTQWVFVLAISGGVAALMPPERPLGRCVMGLIVVASVVVTLNPMWRLHWSLPGAAARVGAAAAVLLLLWRISVRLIRRRPGPWLAVSVVTAAGVSAAILGLSATTLLAQLAAGAAACLALLSLGGLVLRFGPVYWLPLSLTLIGSLVLNGYFYARLSGWSVLALMLALPASWLSQLGAPRERWKTALLAGLAILAVTGAAVGLAISEFLAAPDYDY